MPRSMLISRKRLIATAGEQPVPPSANAPPVNDGPNLLNQSHGFTTDEEDEDDKDELRMCGAGDNQPQQSQLIQQLQQQQPQDPSSNSGDQQVDSLTNAIIYFVSLFNQQQQQQQQQLQIQQQLPEPSASPVVVAPVGRLSINQEGTSKRSNNHQKQGQQINQLRKQKQQKQQRQPIVLTNTTKNTTLAAETVAPALPSPPITTPLKNEHDQQIFLNSEDLIDPRLSSHSQGKRSSSISGSGSDDNFVHYCVDCGKRYSTSSNLARHRQTHRDKTDKKAKTCPECDKVYVSMPAFSMHLRTHTQGCICSICGKSFSRPWLLQGHMRTHTGEKPFRCKICDKAFADKSNLRAHIQTHSTTKPFVCVRCNKAFALKSYLCKHVESTCMRASETTCTRTNESQKEPLNLKVLSHRRRNRSGQC